SLFHVGAETDWLASLPQPELSSGENGFDGGLGVMLSSSVVEDGSTSNRRTALLPSTTSVQKVPGRDRRAPPLKSSGRSLDTLARRFAYRAFGESQPTVKNWVNPLFRF